jgi:hypothetical protein
MKSLFRLLSKSIFILLFFYNGQAQTSPEGIVNSEFIFPTTEFPECHASSIVQTKDGFLVTWFAGTHEKIQMFLFMPADIAMEHGLSPSN